MEALISGRAGLALVIDGDRFASIHAEEPERMVPRQPAEFHFLVGEARDFRTVENTTRDEVVRELRLAEDREDALQLVLIAQDLDLPADVRREAIEELEELIQESDVGSYLENVLYAHPLPEGMDLAGAMRMARTAEAWEVVSLLELFWTYQGAIREVRQAWESIPFAEFAGEEEHWQSTAVREGLFRDLARRLADGRSVTTSFVGIDSRPAIRTLPNHPGVLHRWLDALLSISTTVGPLTERHASVVRETSEACTRSSAPTPRVFLSYAERNTAEAQKIYERLKSDGIDVWFDKEILPGQPWREVISREIRRSDIVLVLTSRSFVRSAYSLWEVQMALEAVEDQPEKRIILGRLKEGELPEQLRRYQRIDLFEEVGYAELMHALRERKKTLGRRI